MIAPNLDDPDQDSRVPLLDYDQFSIQSLAPVGTGWSTSGVTWASCPTPNLPPKVAASFSWGVSRRDTGSQAHQLLRW